MIGFVAFFIFTVAASYAWARQFDDRIAPRVSMGPVEVGGMKPELARQLLESKIDTLLVNGIPVMVESETKTLPLSTLVSSDLIEQVNFSLEEALVQAQQARRSPNPLIETWLFLQSFWDEKTVPISVTLADDAIKQNISELFPEKELPGEDARFVFLQQAGAWEIRTLPGKNGVEFDWIAFFNQLETQLERFDGSAITLTLKKTQPNVSLAQADALKEEALNKLFFAPFTYSYTDERSQTTSWVLSRETWSSMLIPQTDGSVGIDKDSFHAFLDPLAEKVERPAQNARLQVENGRVVEFVESQAGQRFDRELMYQELLTASEQATLEIAFLVEEPAVQTGDVNDLGIDQILGVGTSSYRGSPVNRRKNIQNGVDLLNGRLIAPGETFSLVEALKPFETANGYLPELVIKGTKITPELGGGLCQIGTTTFRAAMNSGLPIAERQNHSLVVSYYNDPSNKNPGTDATIYDPAPDFKFVNDTEHYILFQAENLVETQELRFTFWGTTDGRKGSYTPPVVSRWIPVGETQYIETPDLEPGKEKCQEAHIGADASFDYTIVRPDGTEEIVTFTSHYRPLPRICLVGMTPVIPSEPQTSEESEESTDTNLSTE